jgi:hypothetical protein
MPTTSRSRNGRTTRSSAWPEGFDVLDVFRRGAAGRACGAPSFVVCWPSRRPADAPAGLPRTISGRRRMPPVALGCAKPAGGRAVSGAGAPGPDPARLTELVNFFVSFLKIGDFRESPRGPEASKTASGRSFQIAAVRFPYGSRRRRSVVWRASQRIQGRRRGARRARLPSRRECQSNICLELG